MQWGFMGKVGGEGEILPIWGNRYGSCVIYMRQLESKCISKMLDFKALVLG